MVTRATNVAPKKKSAGEYRHGDLRNALLDAAGELVAARGGPDFSLREIAERVGVRHAATYRHFASKEAMLSALAERAFQRMLERFKKVEDRCASDVGARIADLGSAYITMAQDEPGAYRVMFANVREPDADRDAAARDCFDILVRSIADGQQTGLVRRDLPAIAIAASNWSALHGLSMLLLDERLGTHGPAGGTKALLAALKTILREGWLAK